MEIINTNKAPKAVGPYVQGIKIENGFLYVSGQLGLDPTNMTMPSDIISQTKNSLNNIEAILHKAGYTKNDVVKTLVLLSDINDFSTFNEIYANYFTEHKPTRSAFQVSALPLNGKVEIEIIAYKKY